MSSNLLLLKHKSVLFAEDDKIVQEQMSAILGMIFQTVFLAKDGEEALHIYEEKRPDILLLDIMMPGRDGLKLIAQIRQSDYTTPIVILTSFKKQDYLIKAANLAIDGYLIKPVALQSIIDTMCSAIQRTSQHNRIIKLSDNTYYNDGTKEILQNNHIVTLGVKEYELFELLLRNAPNVVTKDEIENRLWVDNPACDSAIKGLVLRIRKKLGDDVIHSVRGLGYRLHIAEDDSCQIGAYDE